MPTARRPWQEELAVVDKTMKAISGLTDPEEIVEQYYNGIGSLIPSNDYVSISRRYAQKPDYVITRSSRFTEHPNPFTERHKLPQLSGGIMGDIAYGNEPAVITNLPERLKADDPAHFYLQGFQTLIALPNYENGEALNLTCMLLPPGADFDFSIVPMLHWSASLFGRGTRNQVLRNELSNAYAALDLEFQTVGQIQRDLLPSELPNIPGFSVAAHYVTSSRAGGDYYDFFPLENGAWGIIIADVSGHGTPAAVLMAITHALAHAHPSKHTPPAMLLTYLNNRLTTRYARAGTFITAFYAILDPAKKTLTYARAGHNPPRLVRNGKADSLDATGALPLGIEPDQIFDEITVNLHSGDLLLLYTDGITEAMAPARDGSRELFGTGRLDQVLLASGTAAPGDIVRSVLETLDEFSQHAPPKDDQTLIALRCL